MKQVPSRQPAVSLGLLLGNPLSLVSGNVVGRGARRVVLPVCEKVARGQGWRGTALLAYLMGLSCTSSPGKTHLFFFFFKARRSFYLKPFFPPSCNFSLLFTSSLLLKDVLLKLMQEKGVPPWLWAQSSSRVPRMQQNLDPQSPWLNLKPLRPVRPGPSTSSGNPGSSWHTVIL